MHSTARRCWSVLVLASALLLPVHTAPTQVQLSKPERPAPFLASVKANILGGRALMQAVSTFTGITTVRTASVGPKIIPVVAELPPNPAAALSWAPVAAKTAQATPAPLATVVVQDGQTLWDIAQRYGVSVDAIAQANGLRDTEVIRVGQKLIIPGKTAQISPAAPKRTAATRTVTVVVQEGQVLWDIARTYGVSVDAIVEANGLQNAELIRVGQRLVVPAPATVTVRAPAPVVQPQEVRAPAASALIARGFLWPTRGSLTSRFGWRWRRHHDGIDIAAPWGSTIAVAKPGRVVFVGWYYGYGRAVIVDHGNGLTTLYGHASALLVRIGQMVQAGQAIARVGCTGRCSGSHVHFEIRINGQAVNPLKYL